MRNQNFALSKTLGSVPGLLAACSRNRRKLSVQHYLYHVRWPCLAGSECLWRQVERCGPTPNIDRLATEACDSIAAWWPTHLWSLTCRDPYRKYSHLNGFLTNEKEEFNGAQQTFPKLLQQAGYQTAIIGKWHLASEPTVSTIGISFRDKKLL